MLNTVRGLLITCDDFYPRGEARITVSRGWLRSSDVERQGGREDDKGFTESVLGYVRTLPLTFLDIPVRLGA